MRSRRTRARTVRERATIVVGVDTGGTFTDVVFRRGAELGAYKVSSTPEDPARAVLSALSHLFGEHVVERLTYGTTVATNAMLQRRGAPTALVTTAGFEDVLEIGRQARPYLYDLEPLVPAPLVPPALRIGLHERTLHDGSVERRPAVSSIARLRERVRKSRVRSVAVCLLHAHGSPGHERAVGEALKRLGIPVTLSHQLCPMPGEYERTSTTVANAYVRPIVATHLETIANRSRVRRLRVMQSNGGAIGVTTAAREPMRTMLSGPAGGVMAAFRCARAAGLERVISLDMGGTSTDVALIAGALPRRAETRIGGVPLLVPSIDIHTVGAGGGSLASVDAGGALKVGPESAGADPGPACYGRGTAATVTDANVVLGRLRAEDFLGGTMALDRHRAHAALEKLASRMRVRSGERAAEGVVRVVEGTMERAIRVITVERGQDPRTCALLAFGGAAGLHACGLAEALAVPEVLVPPDPGLFSASGVLDGPVLRDVLQPLRKVDPEYAELVRAAGSAAATARRDLRREGFRDRDADVRTWIRARYVGQSIELEVPLGRDFRRAFDRAHERLLHTSSAERSVEVVGLRVSAAAGAAPIGPRTRKAKLSAAPRRRRVEAWIGGRVREIPLFAREALGSTSRVVGPAIVTEYSSTVLVPPDWELRVDRHRNLRLRRRGRSSRG